MLNGVLDRGGAADFLPALYLLLLGLAGLAGAWLVTAPRSGRYLVVASPQVTLGQTINMIRAANGSLVGQGYFPNVALAASTEPDFPRSARKAGAWLALSAPLGPECDAPLSSLETTR